MPQELLEIHNVVLKKCLKVKCSFESLNLAHQIVIFWHHDSNVDNKIFHSAKDTKVRSYLCEFITVFFFIFISRNLSQCNLK